MKKRLIVNADDFGFDPEATTAILRLLQKNKLSSTTVMANLVKSEDLIRLKNIPRIGVGIHINLLDGKPISPSNLIPSLLDQDGLFLNAKSIFKKALSGKISSREIGIEIKAQVDFLLDYGLNLTHADSHQHLHHFPILGKLIREQLSSLGIKKIRNSALTVVNLKPRSIILAGFTKFSPIEKALFSTTQGLISDLSFGSEITQSSLAESIKRSFTTKSDLELMTHPAVSNRADSYLDRKREFELWMDLDTENFLRALGIEMVNYQAI